MENLPALPDDHINNLIAQAIDKHVPVEALEKLLAMRKELKLEFAQEQFNIAMATFQARCPIIKKTKPVVVKGRVMYRFAPIESIVSQVKHLLQELGFSYSIDTLTGADTVTTICTAHHVNGHSRLSAYTVPLTQGTDLMSATQIVAATLTFAKRYAFCNAFGIMTGDEDVDGVVKVDVPSQPPKLITQAQIDELTALCATAKLDLNMLLKRYTDATVDKLTQSTGDLLIAQCKQYIQRIQNAQQG